MASSDGLEQCDREMIRAMLARLPNLETAVLFGSRAMGTHSPSSDIDLALFGDNLTLEAIGHLAADLEETTLPVNVDLLRYDTITSEPLKEHIARYGKLLWERNAQS